MCEHKNQMWNIQFTHGHCKDCGAEFGVVQSEKRFGSWVEEVEPGKFRSVSDDKPECLSDAACLRIMAASVADVGMPDTADQLRAIAERMERAAPSAGVARSEAGFGQLVGEAREEARKTPPAESIVVCDNCKGKYWIKAENDWWWYEHLYRCPHCQAPF